MCPENTVYYENRMGLEDAQGWFLRQDLKHGGLQEDHGCTGRLSREKAKRQKRTSAYLRNPENVRQWTIHCSEKW